MGEALARQVLVCVVVCCAGIKEGGGRMIGGVVGVWMERTQDPRKDGGGEVTARIQKY